MGDANLGKSFLRKSNMQSVRYIGFVFMTIFFWGVYAPVLQQGQILMGVDKKPSRIEPLICVGLAYFMIAVLVPLVVLFTKGEAGRWSLGGLFWSFVAGVIGAFGAIGMIISLEAGGSPVYVVPLVFGGAPVINTLVTMTMNRTMRNASILFYVGVVIVALGAAGVMYYRPSHATIAALGAGQKAMVAFGIGLTALCWGAYGPILHRGQVKMSGSRLRPFICVGLAYFVVAVIMPLLLQNTIQINQGKWTLEGASWSVAAGAAGALGALGIIYAFNFGGKPLVVMPLVFGGAPVVNTFYELFRHQQWGSVMPMFFVSLAVVICGAVTVLLTAPRGPAHGPASATPPEPAKTP
jgi:hypothetical protein